MNLKCKKCGYEWEYKGKKKPNKKYNQYVVCYRCRYLVKIPKILPLLFTILFFSLTVSAIATVGEYYERECNKGICTINLYTYQKYYNNGTDMLFLNESFDTQNCRGYDVCVDNNEHQFYLKRGDLNARYSYDNNDFISGLEGFGVIRPIDRNPIVIDGTTATKIIGNGLAIEYQYLPNRVKESIIISNRDIALALFGGMQTANLDFRLDNNYNYTESGGTIKIKRGNIVYGIIEELAIYDADEELIDVFGFDYVSSDVASRTARSTILRTNITRMDIRFPIKIDPTIEFHPSVAADGFINDVTVSKNTGGVALRVGSRTIDTFPQTEPIRFRAGIDANITLIPDDADILEMFLNLTAYDHEPHEDNTNITVTQMTKNLADWNGSIEMNHADMGNEQPDFNMLKNYTLATFSNTTTRLVFNLTNATADLQAQLSNSTFSFGFVATHEYTNAPPNRSEWQFRSSENAVVSGRPYFTVIYKTDDSWELAVIVGVLGPIFCIWLMIKHFNKKKRGERNNAKDANNT